MGSFAHTFSASLLALLLATPASAQTATRAQTPPQPVAPAAAPTAPPAAAGDPAASRDRSEEQAAAALAQADADADALEPPPGHVTEVSGAVTLERANQMEDVAAGLPLMVGDRLRTDNASVDITWADSSTLRLARYTEMDVLSTRMVRVPRGTVNVLLALAPGDSASDQLTIDVPSASIRFFAAGRYRLSVTGNEEVEVELAVIDGHAQLMSDQGQVALAAGEKSMVRGGGAPSQPVELTAQVNDASTYDYSADVAAFQSPGQDYQSTQYLPEELYGYASVLDTNGSWQSDANYGYVWYPRVAADWRPYYRGQWRYYKPWGWTWIGSDRWAYPTHHYGRWGIGARGWYWIPARQWGPAWVSWGIASNYVSWCPLGWNGRPVVNIYNYQTTYAGPARYRPGRSWTVVPSGRFGYHDVARYRVTDEAVFRDRPVFVTQAIGPAGGRGRSTTPGTYIAVPRGGRAAAPNGRSQPALGRIEPLDEAAPRPGAIYRRSPGEADGYQSESPYERARRVMDGRVDSPAATQAPGDETTPGSVDVNRNGGAVGPAAVPRGGSIYTGRHPYDPANPNRPQRSPRNPYGAAGAGTAAGDSGAAAAPGTGGTAVRRAPGRSSDPASAGSAPAGGPPPAGMYRARPQSATPPPPPATAPPMYAAPRGGESRREPPPSSAGRDEGRSGRSSEGRSSGSSAGRSSSGEGGARRRQP